MLLLEETDYGVFNFLVGKIVHRHSLSLPPVSDSLDVPPT